MERVKKLIFFLLVMCNVLAVTAQDPRQDRINFIKNEGDAQYKWGEGIAHSKDEANQLAIGNLIEKIKLSATGASENHWANDERGDGYDRTEGSFKMLSSATLMNLEEISFQNGDDWVVFRYISNKDLQQATNDRIDCEKDLIAQGVEQEKNLNIAGALRYYNWALTMISYYQDNFKVTIEDKETFAGSWLPDKISSILRNLDFRIVEGKIEVDEDSYDRYTVCVEATYAGNPVSALDVKYFNGEGSYTAHSKSGEFALKFHDISSLPSIELTTVYGYEKEAREVAGSSDLKAAYANSDGAYSNDALASHSLPLKYVKGNIKNTTPSKKSTDAQALAAADSPETAPIVKRPKSTVERAYTTDDASYIAAMKKVEQAIRTKDYASVKDIFTPEGYDLFLLMTRKAKLSMSAEPSFTVEKSKLFTIGKGLPVSVKNGKHVSKETIVFRFEQDRPIIKSVAYALTARAENDIFRKADWSLESRYSLLTFMEDYQTAFSTQNIDYIKKIFSDSAIIITGKVVDKQRSGFVDYKITNPIPRNKIVYTHQTKDQYIRNLSKMFNNNAWTHIEFEENEISKSSTSGLLDHEVMWIEIRQNWSSASGYNDVGFLGLQINLKPSGSQINIRTWTDDFIPIEELKQRFPTDITF